VRRGLAVIGAVCAAFVSWIFSALFGINGPNYDGWSRTFAAFVGIIVLALVVALVTRPALSRLRATIGLVAGVVVAVLVAVSIHWYGDGTPDSAVPSILAWVGLAALTVAAGAMSIPSIRRGGSVLTTRREE
jgi:peptidoglycan/LPS O-acetylase OafA/YrhL